MFDLVLVAYAAGDDARVLLKQAVVAIVNPVITLFFILAFSVFTYGIFEFIKSADDPDGRKKGQKHMMYGIAGFFIMVSVFAVIRIIMNTLGVPPGDLWIINP